LLTAITGGLLMVGGCSSATQDVEGAPVSSANVITRQQIVESNVRTAYEVVRKLQPSWLRKRSRGAGTPDPVRVYVDGANRGEVDQLRLMDAATVGEMRYLNSADATTRFGTGHTSGAILVVSVR
jgi:hypothetical protein